MQSEKFFIFNKINDYLVNHYIVESIEFFDFGLTSSFVVVNCVDGKRRNIIFNCSVPMWLKPVPRKELIHSK